MFLRPIVVNLGSRILGLRNIFIPMKFLIVASGYNCDKFVKKCVDSVLAQTYKNYDAVFISDGSTDNTGNFLDVRMFKERDIRREGSLFGEIFKDNQGAAKRRFDAIHKYAKDEETIVLLLGLDDELKPDCLLRIVEEYKKGNWMTYGNWINQYGVMLPKGFLFFPDKVHENRDYRRVKYRSTAPNTFKKFLFDQIPEEDFKIDGKWIDSTTESELMFSCLEMCGKERIGVIEEPIYLYNESLPGGTLKRLGAEYKYKIYNQIIQRPKKPLLKR